MNAACNQEDCTVAETGVCLLNNDSATCPNRLPILEMKAPVDIGAELPSPKKNPSFTRSQTLTPTQTRSLMSKRYCRLVGILGAPDAGKTASLVSLYLLVARGRLTGFKYADSQSLMAFDGISQGARRWNEGKLPDQLTTHTEMADDRNAGFLHLRLKSDSGDTSDLLLPDLPGEWSTAMVDSKRVERLDFLKRADVVWLMVDGRQLSEPSTKQWALHRTKLLMQRLADLVSPPPPVILVVTRRDQGEPDEKTIQVLREEARKFNLDLDVIMIASFADNTATAPGAGIAELIGATTKPTPRSTAFWPSENVAIENDRAIMRFRILGRIDG